MSVIVVFLPRCRHIFHNRKAILSNHRRHILFAMPIVSSWRALVVFHLTMVVVIAFLGTSTITVCLLKRTFCAHVSGVFKLHQNRSKYQVPGRRKMNASKKPNIHTKLKSQIHTKHTLHSKSQSTVRKFISSIFPSCTTITIRKWAIYKWVQIKNTCIESLKCYLLFSIQCLRNRIILFNAFFHFIELTEGRKHWSHGVGSFHSVKIYISSLFFLLLINVDLLCELHLWLKWNQFNLLVYV